MTHEQHGGELKMYSSLLLVYRANNFSLFIGIYLIHFWNSMSNQHHHHRTPETRLCCITCLDMKKNHNSSCSKWTKTTFLQIHAFFSFSRESRSIYYVNLCKYCGIQLIKSKFQVISGRDFRSREFIEDSQVKISSPGIYQYQHYAQSRTQTKCS